MKVVDRMGRDDVEAFQEATVDEAKALFERFSQKELKDFSKLINNIRDEMYPRNRGSKRGNVRQWFKEPELRQVIPEIQNPSVRLAFLFQFFFCLRVSEIGECEWDKSEGEDKGMLRVYQPKNDRVEYVPVHGRTVDLLRQYDEFNSYSPQYLHKCWRSVRDDVGGRVANVVAESRDGKNLYQFGTHSFRRTSATVFAQEVGADSLWVDRWLRHSNSSKDSLRYVGYPGKMWREHLEKAFDDFYDLIPEPGRLM